MATEADKILELNRDMQEMLSKLKVNNQDERFARIDLYLGDKDKENMSSVCKELDELSSRARRDKEIALGLKELNDEYKLLKAKLLSCERRSDQKEQAAFQVNTFVATMGLEVKIGQDKIHLIYFNIDRIDPDRKYIISLHLKKEHSGKKQWSIAQCKPELADLSKQIQELNASDNLSAFCKAVRQKFLLLAE